LDDSFCWIWLSSVYQLLANSWVRGICGPELVLGEGSLTRGLCCDRYHLTPVHCRTDQLGSHRRPDDGIADPPRVGFCLVHAYRFQERDCKSLSSGRDHWGLTKGTFQDGSIDIAVDAMRAAATGHTFLSVTKQGLSAIVETEVSVKVENSRQWNLRY